MKKLKVDNPIIGVAMDCPRKEIWRMKLFPEYKGNRGQDDGFMGGPFFKMAYEEILAPDSDVDICQSILKLDQLEADDCIAIMCKYIISRCIIGRICIGRIYTIFIIIIYGIINDPIIITGVAPLKAISGVVGY